MKRGMSLRLRLALLSTALLGVALLVFSLLVYFTLEQALSTEVDRALVDRARVIYSSITVDVTPRGVVVAPPDVDAIATGGAVAQVALFNGDIVRSTVLGRSTLPISREALAAA